MTIEIITPQFTREAGAPAPGGPPDWEDFDKLDMTALREMGCRRWNDPNDPEDGNDFDGKTLLLFPGEWFESIPQGFKFVDIFGNHEKFDIDSTDNDIRFGCLPFGVLR